MLVDLNSACRGAENVEFSWFEVRSRDRVSGGSCLSQVDRRCPAQAGYQISGKASPGPLTIYLNIQTKTKNLSKPGMKLHSP